MPNDQFVESNIRLSDLRKAMKQLSVNRAEYQDTDSADILVSECIATFRAVGTETEVPVTGLQPGTVRLPMKQLNDVLSMAKTYKLPEIPLRFEPGLFRVVRSVRRHPDIFLGIIPDRKLDLPVDAGVLDTLAVAQLLTPEEIANQGLRERVEVAQRRASEAVSRAFDALEHFAVPREEIQKLIDARAKVTSEKLRSVVHDHV
jgi:hypothetical protein